MILGIESSCDDTAAAVVVGGEQILANIIDSQALLHRQHGGVIPEIASRAHAGQIDRVVEQALEEAKRSLDQIDFIAVTQGPGLIGALLVGLNFAKALSLSTGIPLIPVNHVWAHLYAALMGQEGVPFPLLGCVVSGGHTFLAVMESYTRYTIVGQTVDDAAGEAFDKVARLLDLPYPGGPEIEKLSREGDPKAIALRSGMVKGHPLDFSFSGLKTAVLYASKTGCSKADLAASFQRVVIEDLQGKIKKAAIHYGCHGVAMGGGVSANGALRTAMKELGLPLYLAPIPLAMDNAAMIAGLAYHLRDQAISKPLHLEPFTRTFFA